MLILLRQCKSSAHFQDMPLFDDTWKYTNLVRVCDEGQNWSPIYIYLYIYDLVPKGVQKKRTEVLENKADRMWVSNAFF